MKEIIYLDAGVQDMKRPSERPPKSNWRMEMIKKALGTLQHVSSKKTAEIVWHFFTQPGKVGYSPAQKAFAEKAEKFETHYHNQKIQHYRWGTEGPKILLSHGWRSKATDFRRMTESLVKAGYVVEGIDMVAHGVSEGKHTALPEFRDILKDHYIQHGPYEAIIGHSLGGLAAGMVASELAKDYQPKKLFLLAFPPFVRYFFKDIVSSLGFKNEVYEAFCDLVDKNYDQPIDYFDLRHKAQELKNIELHFIYDEQDETVPLMRGHEVYEYFPEAQFVQTKGLGHYKIMAWEGINDYILEHLKTPVKIEE